MNFVFNFHASFDLVDVTAFSCVKRTVFISSLEMKSNISDFLKHISNNREHLYSIQLIEIQ